jgi:hypothetical protein
MTDLNENDLELGHTTPPPDGPERPGHARWVAPLAVVLLAVGAWLGYMLYQRSLPEPEPVAETAPAPPPPLEAAPAPPSLEGEAIDLPPLAETDSIVRMLVGKLSSHPKVLAWLATAGLIESFTVVTLNISEGTFPAARLPALAPRGPFRVRRSRGRMLIDPRSYRRYDDHAAAIDALDATGTARLYLTLKPRISDAYRQLGHPDGNFDPVLARAMSLLLSVPVIDGDITVREKIVSYAYADPATEALSPAARHFLRMGPDNVRLVKAKLREIGTLLGLALERRAGA